ncbi:MAG: hypothetical protein IIA89_13440 [Chloroflexi bacterium]|nr:hypothetical protein [Chloroflexota bacterium]
MAKAPNDTTGTISAETAGLLGRAPHHADYSKVPRRHWRVEYAERTNGDLHDDKGVLGVNRGENRTNLTHPHPEGGSGD